MWPGENSNSDLFWRLPSQQLSSKGNYQSHSGRIIALYFHLKESEAGSLIKLLNMKPQSYYIDQFWLKPFTFQVTFFIFIKVPHRNVGYSKRAAKVPSSPKGKLGRVHPQNLNVSFINLIKHSNKHHLQLPIVYRLHIWNN